jgi:catalase
LFDAVMLLPAAKGVSELATPAARDFVADAFAHCKFIGYVPEAKPLLQRAGVDPDDGCMEVTGPASMKAFVEKCRALRYFERSA